MKRLYVVRVERKVCASCLQGKHEECAPIAIDRDSNGYALDRTAYVNCNCLCLLVWFGRVCDSEAR